MHWIEEIGARPARAQAGELTLQGVYRGTHTLLDFVDVMGWR
jgi:hypothetical protein